MIFPGSISGAAYVALPAAVTTATTGTVERQIDVTFTASGSTVVLAWGGHIASQIDWGTGNSAGAINGTGNGLNNRLTGNGAANTLNGRTGASNGQRCART